MLFLHGWKVKKRRQVMILFNRRNHYCFSLNVALQCKHSLSDSDTMLFDTFAGRGRHFVQVHAFIWSSPSWCAKVSSWYFDRKLCLNFSCSMSSSISYSALFPSFAALGVKTSRLFDKWVLPSSLVETFMRSSREHCCLVMIIKLWHKCFW